MKKVTLMLCVILVLLLSAGCKDITDSFKPGSFGNTPEEKAMVEAITEKYGDLTEKGDPRFLEAWVTTSVESFIPVDVVSKYSRNTEKLYAWFVYDNFDEDELEIEWIYLDNNYSIHTFKATTGKDFGRGSFILEQPDDGWVTGDYEVIIRGRGVQKTINFEIINGATVSTPLDFSNGKIKLAASTPSSTPVAASPSPSTVSPVVSPVPPVEYEWTDNIITVTNNMLVNGNAENGMTGWIALNEGWGADNVADVYEGEYFFWPQYEQVPSTYMYQDVPLKDINRNSTLLLTGWLCNWDQPPNDCATLVLEILDRNGDVIDSYSREQRNAEWKQHSIFAPVPQNAATARVKMVATRYVGMDNDAYFDDLSLTVISDNVAAVTLRGNTTTAKAGDQVTLIASNGFSQNPADFIWSSSYDSIASVNENGVVTFHSENEVTIYVKDKMTGIEASYVFNQVAN